MGILGGFSGFLTEYCYGGRPPSSYNHPREELALTLEHLAAIVGIVEPKPGRRIGEEDLDPSEPEGRMEGIC